MFLLVDGAPLQTPSRDRGIGRYTSNLIAGLKKARPGWRIQVVEHARLEPIPPGLIHGLPVRRFHAPLTYDLARIEHTAVNDRYFADWLITQRADHLLFSSVFEWMSVIPKFDGPRPPASAVMYDLILILFQHQYGMVRPEAKWYQRRVRDMARMDVLYAISEAAAADTRRLLGPDCPRTVNVRGGVDPNLRPLPEDRAIPAAAAVHRKFGIVTPFVLYVGGYDYRKNLSGAVAGFAALPPDVRKDLQLVIACHLPPELREETHRTADQLGLGERVVTTGFVSDEELIILYQTCRAFFFPSYYEGLGLPVLEALRCGAPVVCSNSSSLPEFAGEVSWLCDPGSPSSMAAALRDVLAEPYDVRRADRMAFAESFTWEKTAEAVVREIEDCRSVARPRRPRVAWVAAEPPPADPHATYGLDLLTVLGERFDLELVLPTAAVPADLAARFRVLTGAEVDDRHEARPFDCFVYSVGPAGPCPLVTKLARRHRGLVALNHPDPSALPEREIWELIRSAEGVVARSVAAWRWVRSRCGTPVSLVPCPGTGSTSEFLAACFASAVEATAARLDASDRRWLDWAANTIAAVPGPVPGPLFDDWARLREEARRTVVPQSAQPRARLAPAA
jgi:glycosyltransferase involved in cell wall biosynthesis